MGIKLEWLHSFTLEIVSSPHQLRQLHKVLLCQIALSTFFAASFTWSEELFPVLHRIAKCSQLLVKGLYFSSPSLLLAL